MKKNSCMDETVNPKVVFNDDALVVDYLNALLTSAPAMSLDSGEMKLVHLAMESGWKLAGIGNAYVDNSMNFETERLKMETELLGIENKSLKFKTELANIDAQVLRSENDNLKAGIASLKEQLDELRSALDDQVAENSKLKTMIDPLLTQFDIATTSAEDAASQLVTDSASNVDQESENEIESAAEPAATDDNIDVAVAQNEEPASSLAEPPDIIPCASMDEIAPNPVTVVLNQSLEDRACSGVDPDTAIISRALVINDRNIQKSGDEAVIYARKRVVVDVAVQSSKPVTKIIKQHHINKHQKPQEPNRVAEVIPLDSARQDKAVAEGVRKQDFVQQRHIVEPESKHEDVLEPDKAVLLLDGSDDIDMEPAPAPKTVVRRIVKNYEDLQNEADSTNAPLAGHNVIL